MSSYKAKDQGEVYVKSKFGRPLVIQLLDHGLRSVATGYGELQAKVPTGLYLLQYNAGSAQEQTYIRVTSDKPYHNFELELPIPSAAPIAGGSTTHEYHAYPASQLSLHPNQVYGLGGCLMIFASSVDGDGRAPVKLDSLSIWNSDTLLISNLAETAERSDQEGWAGLCSLVAPGGYTLRWRAASSSRWSGSRSEPQDIDQSLWVARDWITIVFIAHDSSRQELNRQGASIYMAAIGEGFVPFTDPNQERVNQALELALSGLRAGNSVVPDDLLQLLLETKFNNPMLGIIGAHALLQRRKPDWKLFYRVVRTLERLIPGHPDVIALRLLGKLTRNDESKTRVPSLKWPPMVYAAYRGLIARDWHEWNRVVEGSVAERAAAQLLSQGPWSCWIALNDQITTGRRPSAVRPRNKSVMNHRVDSQSELDVVLREIASRSSSTQTKSMQRQDELADPAVKQVSRYLYGLGQFETDFDLSTLSFDQLRQVGLPVASVRRAIGTLAQPTAPRIKGEE